MNLFFSIKEAPPPVIYGHWQPGKEKMARDFKKRKEGRKERETGKLKETKDDKLTRQSNWVEIRLASRLEL